MTLLKSLVTPGLRKVPDGPVKDVLRSLFETLQSQHQQIRNNLNTLLIDEDYDPPILRKWNGSVNEALGAASIVGQGDLALLDTVNTGQIVDTAVTEAKLANLAVTLAKVAANAVDSTKIVNLAVTEAKLAALSVSLGKLAADSVDKDKLTVPGVDADGKLVLAQIGSGDADNISESATKKWAGETGADKTIDHTAASIISQGDLATLDEVDTTQIANDAITASKILAGEIGTGHLAALAVTAGKIDALAIETGHLAANAVTAAKIAAGTITADEMAALSIGTRELIAESITSAKIAALTIEADVIKANAIITSKINGLAVTTGKIEDNAVTVPVSAFEAGIIAISRASETMVITISIVATGDPIQIVASAIAGDPVLGQMPIYRLYRDATLLLDTGELQIVEAGKVRPSTFVYVDTPGAGTYDYDLRMQLGTSHGATGEATNRSLSVLMLKK